MRGQSPPPKKPRRALGWPPLRHPATPSGGRLDTCCSGCWGWGGPGGRGRGAGGRGEGPVFRTARTQSQATTAEARKLVALATGGVARRPALPAEPRRPDPPGRVLRDLACILARKKKGRDRRWLARPRPHVQINSSGSVGAAARARPASRARGRDAGARGLPIPGANWATIAPNRGAVTPVAHRAGGGLVGRGRPARRARRRRSTPRVTAAAAALCFSVNLDLPHRRTARAVPPAPAPTLPPMYSLSTASAMFGEGGGRMEVAWKGGGGEE